MAGFKEILLFFFLGNFALAISPTVSLSGQGAIIGTATTWRSSTPAVNTCDACYQNWGIPGKVSDAKQAIFNNPPNGPPPTESTDCLYINVFAPANATITSKLPVLFWIYGGGLQGGSAGITYYDGTSFAANQGIILVSFNYRTNVFGQSNSPAIKVGDSNVGLWDQRLSLQWIHDNIAQFGGDPNQITIWGESAGAFSVHQLLASPPIPGFAGAIMNSKGASTKPQNSSDQWTQLSTLLNCEQTPANATAELERIQNIPAQIILSTISNNSITFHPIIDNLTIVDSIKTTITAGTAAKIPVLIGFNAGEAQIAFSVLLGETTTDTSSLTKRSQTTPNILTNLLALDALIPDVLAKAFTDYQFTCPTRAFAQYLSQNKYKVWRYYFNATFTNTNVGYADAGSYHPSELPIIFGTYPVLDVSGDEAVLSSRMQTACGNFVKNAGSESPGPGLGEVWPEFVGGTVDKPFDMAGEDVVGIVNGPGYLGVVKEGSVDRACLLHPSFWKYAEASY